MGDGYHGSFLYTPPYPPGYFFLFTLVCIPCDENRPFLRTQVPSSHPLCSLGIHRVLCTGSEAPPVNIEHDLHIPRLNTWVYPRA